MAITAISRDWGVDPCLVRITCTDALTTVIGSGYLTSQATAIAALNNGAFQWQDQDGVFIAYSGGEGFFTYEALTNTLVQIDNMVQLAVPITAAQFNGMYAAPILVSIPNPGAGYIIDVIRWGLDMFFVTTGFAAGGAIALQYGNTVHGGGVTCCGTIAAASINGFTAASGQVAATGNMGPGANAATQIYLSNATAAFTTGDGTFALTVNYNIRAV